MTKAVAVWERLTGTKAVIKFAGEKGLYRFTATSEANFERQLRNFLMAAGVEGLEVRT